MAKITDIVTSESVGVLVCKALGLEPALVNRISFDMHAGDCSPLEITVVIYANDAVKSMDWKKIIKSASVTVAEKVSE